MIDNEGNERIYRNENPSDLTKWGFRVQSAHLELRGTKWNAIIPESIAPEFQHFTRAGLAAVADSIVHC